jgi:hypothetical protein
MDDSVRREIEWACARLCFEYARSIDFGDHEGFAGLFAEDGILDVGVRVQGRDKILAGLTQRDPQLRSRHVMTNIVIDVEDERAASGISYLSLYRHVGPESEGDAPVALPGPAAVGHYADEFERTPDGWRIGKRVLHLAFMRPDAFPERMSR